MPQQSHRNQQTESSGEVRFININRDAALSDMRNSAARDFTSYLKFYGNEAGITFKNDKGLRHEYKLKFSPDGKVTISADDVTGVLSFYYESRTAQLGSGRSITNKLTPALDKFMELIKKNTPNVTREEAYKVLVAAYLKAGYRDPMQKFEAKEDFILDPDLRLDNKAAQKKMLSSSQLGSVDLGVASCLTSVFGLSLATYNINLRHVKEFRYSKGGTRDGSYPETKEIYSHLRARAFGPEGTALGGGAFSLPIKHDGKVIGTFYCHRSTIDDAPQKYKDIVYNAPFGAITFMHNPGYEDPKQPATHVGFVTQSATSGPLGFNKQGAEVTHFINDSALRDRVEEHKVNGHTAMGINADWEVSGIFIPSTRILAVPQDPKAFDKTCINVALVTADEDGHSDDVSINELAKHLKKHSQFWKGVPEDHIKKAIFDMNADRFTGEGLYNKSTLPMVSLRMPKHWTTGLDLKLPTQNSDGKISAYLFVPR